jgi:hypothetical protein
LHSFAISISAECSSVVVMGRIVTATDGLTCPFVTSDKALVYLLKNI